MDDVLVHWQPIDTAPRDGKFFLMFRIDAEPVVVNWPKGCYRGIWDSNKSGWAFGGEGTHWMPLPAPPLD